MNTTIIKIKQKYQELIQEESTTEEDMKIKIVYDIFMEEMGYKNCNYQFELNVKTKHPDIIIFDNKKNPKIIIETKKDKKVLGNNDIIQLANYIRNSGVNFGILTNGIEYILINTCIYTQNNTNSVLTSQIVFYFNLLNPKNKDFTPLKFFEYLSYENLFENEVTNYFKDIAQFKAIKYSGDNKSWNTYKSTLLTFFDYYAHQTNKYSKTQVENISIKDFEDFINYKKEKTNKSFLSEDTIKNYYSHISSMLNTLVSNEFGCINRTAFDNSRKTDLSNIISGTTVKKIEVIENSVFEKALNYLTSQKNFATSTVIFILASCYGFERDKIHNLKWDSIILEKNLKAIKIDNRILPLVPLIEECFDILNKERISKKIKSDYVFVSLYKKKYNQISTSVINNTFNSIKCLEGSEKYKLFSAQYVRNCLIVKLFESNYSIDDIIYLTGTDIDNISSYITTQQIIDRHSHLRLNIKDLYGGILNKSITANN